MAAVFVSYSREDRGVAQSIIDAVERAGLDVFREHSVTGDDSVAQQTREQFQTAQCVICLWSEEAAHSTFMQEEIQHAIRAWSEGRLVLATLDDAALPVGLRDLQGIPIRKGAAGIDAAQLLAAVRLIVEPSPSGAAPAAMAHDAPRPTAPLPRRHGLTPLVAVLAVLVAAGTTLSWVSGDLDPPQRKARADMGGGMGKMTSPSPEVAPPPPRPPLPSAPEPPRQTAEVPLPPNLPTPLPAPGQGKPQGAPKATPPEAVPAPPRTPAAAPPRSSPGVAPAPEPSDSIPVFLVVLVLGVAIGAGSVWAWATWSRATRDRARVPSGVAPQGAAQPIAFDPAHQVFVSYSRQDGRAVEQLVKEIEQAGYAVWIDRHSTGSQRYAAPIVRAIKTSRLVALMCSQNAFTSDHVIREVYVAGDYKKPFIAFQLDGSDFPDDVQYFVSGFPRVQTEALDIQQLRSELARLVTA